MKTRAAEAPTRPRLLWWKEAAIIVGFYLIYSVTRNQFGSANLARGAEPTGAFRNALSVIRWEKDLGIFREHAVQNRFLGHSFVLRFFNVFYGTAHFAVTIGAFIWMYKRAPQRFVRWRNALAFTTLVALIGFSLFPLMPPRLLNDQGRYGGSRLVAEQHVAAADMNFVDTLERYGGLWSFDSGTMTKISNQYAAMPSLHCAWATWCAFVLWRKNRRWWAKMLIISYPLATVFGIVVTANHYLLDAVGGLLALGIGWLVGNWWEDLNQWRLAR